MATTLTFKGDGKDNTLSGTPLTDDIMYGYGGNDKLSGGGGNDKLYGGVGSDVLNGGAGSDKFYGGQGSDQYILTDSEKVVDYLMVTFDDLNAGTAVIDGVTGFTSGEDKIDVSAFGFNPDVVKQIGPLGIGPVVFNGDFLKIDVDQNGSYDIVMEFFGINVLSVTDFIF